MWLEEKEAESKSLQAYHWKITEVVVKEQMEMPSSGIFWCRCSLNSPVWQTTSVGLWTGQTLHRRPSKTIENCLQNLGLLKLKVAKICSYWKWELQFFQDLLTKWQVFVRSVKTNSVIANEIPQLPFQTSMPDSKQEGNTLP